MTRPVAVVVAARNAAETIGAAVRSALKQPEVGRVMVVDDGSSDNTLGVVLGSDDGSGRLETVRLELNQGPARARNIGIAATSEEFVAVLDADDFFLPGRIARLLALHPFDLSADNIAFVNHGHPLDPDRLAAWLERMAPGNPLPRDLSLAEFVEGNISHVRHPRGELGFLKPVMRRALLGTEPYDPSLRLGEDYALYSRLLAEGARFRVVGSCGYIACVRGDSLSSAHSAADLERFTAVDARLAEHPALDEGARAVVKRHGAQSRARFEHRRFLDEKNERGLPAAAWEFARRPGAWRPVVSGIAADKLRPLRRSAPAPAIRLLFRPEAAPVWPHPPSGARLSEHLSLVGPPTSQVPKIDT